MSPALRGGVEAEVLDDPAAIARVDPSDFLHTVEGLDTQLEDAVGLARSVDCLPPAHGLRSIAVLGMGGSGVSGEICRAVLAPVAPVPVATVRDYDLPAWVGPDTLTFAVSYSGNTEETLGAFRQAAQRGARIIAVTTGGRLAQEAAEGGYCVVRVPGGLMPRAALGYVSIPPLVISGRLGLVPGLDDALSEALEVVAARVAESRREVPTRANPAKQLAGRLAGTLPLIWGAEGISAAAAYRWKCQLNENAKVVGACAAFPELNHNEVVGLYRVGGSGNTQRVGGSGNTQRVSGSGNAPPSSPGVGSPAGLVVLRHGGEHPRTARRIEVTASLVSDSVVFVEEVWARGSSALARLLDLVAAGDLTTTYLGIARGVDPAPIVAIDKLKAALGD